MATRQAMHSIVARRHLCNEAKQSGREAGERLRFTEIDIRQFQSITAAVSKAEHAPTKL